MKSLQVMISGIAGLLFGCGLMWSGMARPEVVQGFLDPLGAWNPALALVMIGAIPVAAAGFWLACRRGGPVCDAQLHLPTRKDIDSRLISGAALFGVGWGLAGICPAPALTLLPRLPVQGVVFVVAMGVGLWLASRLNGVRVRGCVSSISGTATGAVGTR